MINISSIPPKSILGKILRFFLKFIPPNSVVFILQGRLRGKKWIKGAGVNGYWLGTYEPENQKIFEKKLKKDDIVYDIGAHAGFYTLLAAEIIGPKGKVFSFEPNPRNVSYLKRHIEMNGYKNIQVLETAVAEKAGTRFFDPQEDSFYGRFKAGEELKVKTVALDDLCLMGELPFPDVVKIDVEGAELDVLKGMVKIMKKSKPIIFLSTHSQELCNSCLNLLEPLGYNFELISENRAKTDKEIFCF
jgi:FkbM family methyltransferase